MSDHTSIRLETTGGTVVAYFAPNFRVEPVFKNNLFAEEMPGEDSGIVQDVGTIRHEVTIQGVFESTDNLPSVHTSDLQSLFSTSGEVTAREQVNRIKDYMFQGGPFNFYDGTDSYTATSNGGVDRANGTFPVVNIDEFRPPSEGGFAKFEYVIKLVVGVETP